MSSEIKWVSTTNMLIRDGEKILVIKRADDLLDFPGWYILPGGKQEINETVEEATQSLIPLIGENGMDWMFANCSTTAQRGALDWLPKFRKAVEPVFAKLYASVKSGRETAIVIAKNSKPDYRQKLQKELDTMKNSEMWKTGKKVRELRPERQK